MSMRPARSSVPAIWTIRRDTVTRRDEQRADERERREQLPEQRREPEGHPERGEDEHEDGDDAR